MCLSPAPCARYLPWLSLIGTCEFLSEESGAVDRLVVSLYPFQDSIEDPSVVSVAMKNVS
jgi:hypothetical protein